MASSDRSANGLARYFATIRNHRILTAEHERELTRACAAGDLTARDELIECNLAFVARIAGEYKHLGVSYEDLLNEGNVGLLEAAERFDPTRGVRFLTYAAWWIRKAILRAVAEHSNLVRLPETQIKLVREFRLEERRLHQRLGRRPRRDEVSETMPVAPERLATLLRAAARPLSLDQPVRDDENGRPLGDTLVDDALGDADTSLVAAEAAGRVLDAVARLPRQKRTVIRRRFGLGGAAPMTLERIGRLLGVSRERVRQLETAALFDLRRLLAQRRSKRGAPGAAGGGESIPRERLRACLSKGGTRRRRDRLQSPCKDL